MKSRLLAGPLLVSLVCNVWAGRQYYRKAQQDRETTKVLHDTIDVLRRVLAIETAPAGAYPSSLYYLSYLAGRTRTTAYRWPNGSADYDATVAAGISDARFILTKESPADKQFVAELKEDLARRRACAGE